MFDSMVCLFVSDLSVGCTAFVVFVWCVALFCWVLAIVTSLC